MASRAIIFQSRRYLSSNISSRVGVIKPRSKPVPPPKPAEPFQDPDTIVAVDEGEIPMATHVKNAALAAFLLSFCFGVAFYSMKAVGQAGSSPEDPLSALKKEAAMAQEKQEQENRTTDEATEMLSQFQSGGFDPDKYEELEEEMEQKKKPWWKVW